jgi:hypothetical protein
VLPRLVLPRLVLLLRVLLRLVLPRLVLRAREPALQPWAWEQLSVPPGLSVLPVPSARAPVRFHAARAFRSRGQPASHHVRVRRGLCPGARASRGPEAGSPPG